MPREAEFRKGDARGNVPCNILCKLLCPHFQSASIWVENAMEWNEQEEFWFGATSEIMCKRAVRIFISFCFA